jgi:hypothetical protein
VPTGFAAHPCRRAVVLIATWLVVLQAFLAGVATAQAAAMAASAGAVGAICHGAGSAAPSDGTTPENADVAHHCCACCISATPAVAPPAPPRSVDVRADSRSVAPSSFAFVAARGAVRAGPSRAPPSLA